MPTTADPNDPSRMPSLAWLSSPGWSEGLWRHHLHRNQHRMSPNALVRDDELHARTDAERAGGARAAPIPSVRAMAGMGPLLLLVCAAGALLWANSPWVIAYEQMLHAPLRLSLGEWGLQLETCRHWINDGLMAVFFFAVGLGDQARVPRRRTGRLPQGDAPDHGGDRRARPLHRAHSLRDDGTGDRRPPGTAPALRQRGAQSARRGSTEAVVDCDWTPLAAARHVRGRHLPCTEIPLAPGTLLLFYTDGLAEWPNRNQEMLVKPESSARCMPCGNGRPANSSRRSVDAVERFSHGAEPEDDVTLLAVKVRR